MLLESGAKVDTKNIDGETPLSLASRAGHTDVVKLLLEAGADVRSMNNYGQTPPLTG